MINVTKTYFPDINEYIQQLNRIWQNEWLTNRGELVLELEEKLKTFLQIDNIIIMNNGTLPIQLALKLLGKNGEIITTPFSYIATTSSIIWENCKPVFVDINYDYLTIDENKIEAAITEKTTAILATHVFGNPCHVLAIEKIAKKYNLSVIYDAAHAFGVKYLGESIFNYGDVSTCSFHATKIFHTGEGGAVFCKNVELRNKLFYSHNFGHNGPTSFHGLGINAKISELQAAMGIVVLKHIEEIFNGRKNIVNFYNQNINFSNFKTIKIREYTEWNYSYYPIIFQTEQQLLNIQKELNKYKIFPRRYFYPSLNTIEYVNGKTMEVSESISSRVLCLPLSHQIDIINLELISKIINNNAL